MKIVELRQVPKSRRGVFHKNGVHMEPHEENTAEYLTLYGFSIEAIRPVNTPKVHNPDFLISGTIWEVKSPTTNNLKTIKKRIHEASGQATRIVIDLRRIKHGAREVEKEIAKRFASKSSLREMILVQKSGTVFDYKK